MSQKRSNTTHRLAFRDVITTKRAICGEPMLYFDVQHQNPDVYAMARDAVQYLVEEERKRLVLFKSKHQKIKLLEALSSSQQTKLGPLTSGDLLYGGKKVYT